MLEMEECPDERELWPDEKAFSDNATHCVTLSTPAEVDDQLRKWLVVAYQACA
jgi:hypothetical protein